MPFTAICPSAGEAGLLTMTMNKALLATIIALPMGIVPLTPRAQLSEPPIEQELLGTWCRDYWMGVCIATASNDELAKLVQLARIYNQISLAKTIEITEIYDQQGRVERLRIHDDITDRTFYRHEDACISDATRADLNSSNQSRPDHERNCPSGRGALSDNLRNARLRRLAGRSRTPTRRI